MNIDSSTEKSLIKERTPLKTRTRHGQKQTFRRKMAEKESRLQEETEKRKKAEELSETDDLTGLPNLRAFKKRYMEEVERVKRSRKKSTLMALDLDNFKIINDTQGHDKGDEILKKTAEALRKSIRAVDFAARCGEKGDEFKIIFTDTDKNTVWEIWNKRLKPITMKMGILLSAGAAEIDTNNPGESEKFADEALYVSKKEKNRRGNTLSVKEPQ